MAFVYTRSDLKSRINAGIHGKIGMLVDANDTVNQAVRKANSAIHFRSTRRKSALTPNLFNSIYEYASPSDLHSGRIIDIPAQAKREDGQFYLVPSEEFDRKHPLGSIAIDDYNNIRILKIASKVDSDEIVLAELDGLASGGGTWALFGDGTNVAADADDYVKGSGSLKFDISAAGGTTAGIQNSTLNSFDLTEYLNGAGAIFVFHRINSATNITNYILRIGSSASNYYSKTITARHDGTAFAAGWQLLRFDLTSLTETGSVTDTAITHMALYMTKTTGKVSETDYKFDYLLLAKGKHHDVKYYSKYGWTNSSGSYLENSTSDTDLLVADTDEFDLIVEKGIEIAAPEVDEYDTAAVAAKKFMEEGRRYQLENPSEAKVVTNEYYAY